MRPWQPPNTHQKLPHDLAAHEAELRLHHLDPFRLGQLALRIEPLGERAVTLDERHDPSGVMNRRVDLEAVADDARVGQ